MGTTPGGVPYPDADDYMHQMHDHIKAVAEAVPGADTGLRNITALTPSALRTANPNLRLWVRRSGSRVTYSVSTQPGSTFVGASGEAILAGASLPAGFTLDNPHGVAFGPIANTTAGAMLSTGAFYYGPGANGLRLFNHGNLIIFAAVSFDTSAAFPTVLPGVPA